MKSLPVFVAMIALMAQYSVADPVRSADESLQSLVNVVNRPVRSAAQHEAKFATALQMIERFRQQYDDPSALGKAAFLAGQSHLSIGQFEQALVELDQALALPMDEEQVPAVRFIRGVTLQKLGRPNEAISYLRETRRLYPESQIMSELQLALASLLAEAGRAGEAVAVLDSLTSPDQPPWVQQQAAAMLPALKQIGEPAKSFSAWDTEGREITLAQYRGKVVLIDFWASWCAPCRAAMPQVKALYDQYNDQGFEIIGISLDNSRTAMQSYVDRMDMEWRQICECQGWDSALARLYEVRGIPKTFLVDQEGNIAGVDLKGERLEAAIERLLE